MAAKPKPTELWWRHHQALQEWIKAPSKDDLSLSPSIHALEELLRHYPDEASNVQKLALSGAFMAKAYSRPEGVQGYAWIGIDVALLRHLTIEEDLVSAAILNLLGAEACLDIGEMQEGQKLLDAAEKIYDALNADGLLRNYLILHRNYINGTFSESALESELAAESYKIGVEIGIPLLDDSEKRQKVSQEIAQIIYGNLDDFISGGNIQSQNFLEKDLISTVTRLALGYSRTKIDNQADAARTAVNICKRYGLPEDRSPIDLRPALLSLSRDELEGSIKELEILTEGFDTRRQAAWLTMIHCTWARYLSLNGETKQATEAYKKVSKYIVDCFDAVTIAVASGDMMTCSPKSPGKLKDEWALQSFVIGYNHIIQHVKGQADFLRIRSLFDEPIAASVEYFFEAYRNDPSSRNRRLLSVFLDALRSPDQDLIVDDQFQDSIDEGIALALDRLMRLHTALKGYKKTATIVLQSVREDTLFICVTGQEQTPFLLEVADHKYAEAARNLAKEQQRQIATGAHVKDEKLVEYGRHAFNELPLVVQRLIRNNETIIIIPDFFSDRESIPFELWHDGNSFISLNKILSRSISLKDLVRTMEQQVFPMKSKNRALCLAAPNVEGFKQLLYASDEILELKDIFKDRTWEAWTFEDYDIDPNFILHGAELADVLHIAAHGEIYAGHEAIVLSDGQRVTVGDIEARGRDIQSLVFLNTCSLGRSRYLGGGVSRGVANALYQAGAPCVIANQLPVEDLSAMLLSFAFYKEAKTKPAGEALRLARIELAKRVPAAFWSATIFVGDAFHLLPFPDNVTDVNVDDLSAQLLFAYTSTDVIDVERVSAYLQAQHSYSELSDDNRLGSSLIWIQNASQIGTGATDNSKIEKLTRLAEEINYPAGKALFLYNQITDDNPKLLDEAITAIEGLSAHSKMWYRALMNCLEKRQRIKIREEPRPILDGPIRVNDPNDPAVQAVLGVQYAIDEEEDRRRGPVRPIQAEKTIKVFSWNAVVLGKENRFPDIYACSSAVDLLCKRLINFINSEEVLTYVVRIVGGLLPYLWSTQRITHLDYGRAYHQSGTLEYAINEAINNTEKRGAVIAHFLPFSNRLKKLIEEKEKKSGSKYAMAIAALNGSSVGKSNNLGEIVDQLLKDLPDNDHAVGNAWMLGELLHAYRLFKIADRKAKADEMLSIYEKINSRVDMAFDPFQQKGYEALNRDPYPLLSIWRSKYFALAK